MKKINEKITVVCSLALAFGMIASALVPQTTATAFADTTVESWQMIDGASVRTADPSGIRFSAKLSESEYEALEAKGASYGMVVAPYEYVAEYGELDTVFKANSNYCFEETEGKVLVAHQSVESLTTKRDGYYYFNGALTKIKESNYSKDFYARAYYTYDGKYYFTPINETNQRSIQDVAEAAIADHYNAQTETTYSADTLNMFVNYLKNEDEINSFNTQAHFDNQVSTELVFAGVDSVSVSYYTGTVGGVEGNFVKATHDVPDDSVTDQGQRGQQFQLKIKSLNTLSALKATGYTKIVIPMYVTTIEAGEKPASWWILGSGGWFKTLQLAENTWTNFEYDIDTAIAEFGANNEIYFNVVNYSDYNNSRNLDLDFYVGGIYATGKPEAPSVEVTAEENEINSFKTEEYFEGRVNASVTGLNGSSTASVSYYTGMVGGVTGNFAKATHHVPDSNVTDAGSRGENLTVDILSLNNLQELYDAGYRTIVIPVYLEAEFAGEPTCTTWYALREPGDWVENAGISNGVWVNYTYSLDAALWYTSVDGRNEVSISITNYSGNYSNGMNVNIHVYIGGIFAQ